MNKKIIKEVSLMFIIEQLTESSIEEEKYYVIYFIETTFEEKKINIELISN